VEGRGCIKIYWVSYVCYVDGGEITNDIADLGGCPRKMLVV